MPPRFLFGPTTADFADTYLGQLRRGGTCLSFGPGGGDLTVGPETRWDDVVAQLPDGWRPDLVAVVVLLAISVPGQINREGNYGK